MDPTTEDVANRREIMIELLAGAVVRYLTQPREHDSDVNSLSAPQIDLNSSRDDRSL